MLYILLAWLIGCLLACLLALVLLGSLHVLVDQVCNIVHNLILACRFFISAPASATTTITRGGLGMVGNLQVGRVDQADQYIAAQLFSSQVQELPV